jgi:outer membrane protein assembly factor BamB
MGEVTVSQCPNCGAPVDAKALSGVDDPKCPYCDHALPVAAQAATPTTISINVPPAVQVGRGVGVAIGLVFGTVGLVIAIIAVVIGLASHSVRHTLSGLTGSSSFHPDGTPVPVANSANFFTLARSGSSESEVLRRVDPIANKVLWSGPPLGTLGQGTPTIVAGPSQVFTVTNSTVVSLDAATGRQEWQASLSNSLASPCGSGCALVVGGRFVTLTKDGVVQALDVSTGSQVWSRRLNSTPRWLEPAGASVLVLDTAAATGGDHVVLVINAASGAARRIAPSCAPDPDTGDATKPTDEGSFLVSPDGTAVTVIITGSSGCVARYRIADGSPVWVTPALSDKNPVPFTLTGNSTAQSATTVLWTNDEPGPTVFGIDAASGAIRQVFSATKASLKPDGVIGSTLIVEVAPTYDSDKPSIVGVDISSGKQRWQLATRVVRSGDSQAVEITPAGPIVASCNSSADSCTFEAVDVQLGTIKSTSVVSASPGSVDQVTGTLTASSWVAAVGWEHVVGLDQKTAAIQWKWPN